MLLVNKKLLLIFRGKIWYPLASYDSKRIFYPIVLRIAKTQWSWTFWVQCSKKKKKEEEEKGSFVGDLIDLLDNVNCPISIHAMLLGDSFATANISQCLDLVTRKVENISFYQQFIFAKIMPFFTWKWKEYCTQVSWLLQRESF